MSKYSQELETQTLLIRLNALDAQIRTFKERLKTFGEEITSMRSNITKKHRGEISSAKSPGRSPRSLSRKKSISPDISPETPEREGNLIKNGIFATTFDLHEMNINLVDAVPIDWEIQPKKMYLPSIQGKVEDIICVNIQKNIQPGQNYYYPDQNAPCDAKQFLNLYADSHPSGEPCYIKQKLKLKINKEYILTFYGKYEGEDGSFLVEIDKQVLFSNQLSKVWKKYEIRFMNTKRNPYIRFTVPDPDINSKMFGPDARQFTGREPGWKKGNDKFSLACVELFPA